MSVIWREAALADLEAVIALIRQDSRTAHDQGAGFERLRDAFEKLALRDDAFLIVGEAGADVVATYQLFIIEAVSLSAPRRAHIEDVRVDVGWRSKGIGTALMADAEARARIAGATLVQLLSSVTREDAHAFYKARGYTPSHRGFKKRL